MQQCKFCSSKLIDLIDLGSQPLANSLLKYSFESEIIYPLVLSRCSNCGLLQTRHELNSENIFTKDYPYFSSVNRSYVEQCRELANEMKSYHSNKAPRVLEIGCNDGYFLENFRECNHLGIEPCESVAAVARGKTLNVRSTYFGDEYFGDYDYVCAFNVLAHSPNINDMIKGMKKNLKDTGSIIVECPNSENLVNEVQFDQIYHEHYFYFTAYTLLKIFEQHELFCFRLEDIPSHGGSMRAWFKKKNIPDHRIEIKKEKFFDFEMFDLKMRIIRNRFQNLFYEKSRMICFGAAAKGNVFLNYCGIDSTQVKYCCDDTPFKQHKFLPGSRIQIVPSEQLRNEKKPKVFILPWNFKDEIARKILLINSEADVFSR